jgi:ATP-dependent DNA helicase RecG
MAKKRPKPKPLTIMVSSTLSLTIDDFTERLLAEGESARLEFKASVVPMHAIAQTVCAFLNAEGGVVVVGVDDDGRPNGSATEVQAKSLHKLLRETITPRVLYDVSFDHTANGGVISVGVPAGVDRPYVFGGAVFVRKGDSTVAANTSALRALVENAAGPATRWERRPSLGFEIDDVDVSLLHETVRRAQDRRGYVFDEPKHPLTTLGQLSLLQLGQLTNAADVLLGNKVSLRHPQTRLRAVCFAADKAADFLDEQLYEGPAFKLLDLAMDFLKRHVSIGSHFREGRLQRESKPKYPFNALREALVNALVHRDYAAFSGSVSVNVYPERIEVWNTGKLPRGISPRDLLLASHPSILVNPDVGHVFYLHELMERVGRGTFKIAQECRDLGMRVPEWKNAGSGVRLTMFAAKPGTVAIDLNDRQRELLEALKPGERIRVAEFVERFGHGITDRQARRDLSDLEGYGLLVRHGGGPKTGYERTKKSP